VRNLLSKVDIEFLRANRDFVNSFVKEAERNLKVSGGYVNAYLCGTFRFFPDDLSVAANQREIVKLLYDVFVIDTTEDSLDYESGWVNKSLRECNYDIDDRRLANDIRATMLCFLINVMEEI
jgi:hypothetical protein